MKLRGREKNKFVNLVLISIITFILLACFITLIIDISNNKGILPVIFFLLMLYSLLLFIYNLLYGHSYNEYNVKTPKIKVSYILFFIVNLILFILSFLVLWN